MSNFSCSKGHVVPIAGAVSATQHRIDRLCAQCHPENAREHYADQLKLALFDKLVAALHEVRAWNNADIRGFEDIRPDMSMLLARRRMLREILVKVPKIDRQIMAPECATPDRYPQYYECGGCGAYHDADFCGDCRQDDGRYSMAELDQRYGEAGWTEIAQSEAR